MSEVTSRPVPVPAPARGRGGGRGGRGGSARGSRGRDRPNGTYKDTPAAADEVADEGELGEMKKQYSSQLPMLKELFSDWTDVDLLFALQETDGDLESTIERISEGHVSKFSDVKSSKEKSKPKPKEYHVTADTASSTRPSRGRGGIDASRGASRGRGERGRGGFRGGRGVTHSTAPGSRAPAETTSVPTSVPTSDAWDTPATAEPATTSSWDTPADSTPKTAIPAEPPQSSAPSAPADGGKAKTWAQISAKSVAPAPIPQKTAPEATPSSKPGVTPSETSSGYVEVTHADAEVEDSPVPIVAVDEVTNHEPPKIVEPTEEATVELTPSKDQLTKENVEHLPDVAQPAPTGTAASTVESSRGPDSVTPSVLGQPGAQPPIGRPAMGGFQTSAYKAAGVGGARSASFNRRLMEQQEAVVMPGNHAVDRTAVQFGSLGLNGDALDVDEDREELETRAQPPQHSPVAQPRASLPPVARQAEAPVSEAPATIKPAPGLPSAPQQQVFSQQSPSASHNQAHGYNQFGRFGQGEASAQKAYDPFGQQLPQQGGAYDGYPAQSQAPNPASQPPGGYSSAGAPDYSSYYTADQRNAYQSYYNSSYGQQNAGAQQDAGAAQQRSGSAFGATAEPNYPSSQPQQAASRYGDNTQQSGNNTPNPAPGSQQAASHAVPGQHNQQPHGQNQHGGYAYGGHPYYNSPYYSAYMSQYSPYGQQGFGGPAGFNKGGMQHNQPQYGYGQSAYDQQHSSSPGNASGFGRDASLGGGLGGGEYGRTSSAQPTQSQQSGSGGFGGGNDPFSRAQGGFSGQSQSYGQGQSGQQGATEDSLKPFGDSKSGPSPSALGQPGRPGSATNNSAQSGLPPPQSHQQGFGQYPGHLGQTSQYGGGLGGLGGQTAGAQTHQQGGNYGSNYGNGAAGFSNSYGSYGGRGGGWGGNYGH